MSFSPIRTDRLIIRRPELGDADAAYERRSNEDVARYQDWEMPYTRERAVAWAERASAMDGPTNDKGWSVTVVLADDPERIIGDLYVGLLNESRTGYVGYTFHPDYWGKGYATEATSAVIEYLFNTVGVSRVESDLHPDNPPSAQVLERCGMLYEGLCRQSFWVGNECSDDMLYGMLRADWETWLARPRHRPDRVELAPVTFANCGDILRLTLHHSQHRFVAPPMAFFRDVAVPEVRNGAPEVTWLRAIMADGEMVGAMLAAEQTQHHERPYLIRFMIDRMHQRRGIGSAALDLFEQWCRDQGSTEAEVSWVPGRGSPEPVYLARGYVPTGKQLDGETYAVKQL